MCGIWCYCGTESYSYENLEKCVENIQNRGPEDLCISIKKSNNINYAFAFARLAINGLNQAAMQPFTYKQIEWICNGEIYNYKNLQKTYSLDSASSGSDCEVIGHLYLALDKNLVALARALDGVFAIAIYDKITRELILARDPYGVRPLYYGYIGKSIFAASEIKALPPNCEDVAAFPPGHIGIFTPKNGLVLQNYHTIPWIKNPLLETAFDASQALKTALTIAVKKRLMTERPCAALLSGGLDSSLIAALVQKELKSAGKPPLETYSIGFAGSSDLYHARLVANHIGSVHHEIVSTPDEFFAAIPEVIKAIESPDITTVRASFVNWLVSKYIKKNSPSRAKVIFNGDGSDEVFGSYLYFYNAPNDSAFEQEIDRLLTDIHHFDVLRSDRSISSHGLEPRTPFLDKQFVAVARSLMTKHLRPTATQPEKVALRSGFEPESECQSELLPTEVLWRKKEAFSDGVSGVDKPWYMEVQERIANLVTMPSKEELETRFPKLTPTTLEAYYYRTIYDGFYNHLTIPYFWMPRWSGETTDPSARTLKVYGST